MLFPLEQVLRRYEISFRDQGVATIHRSPGKVSGEPKADAVAFHQESDLMWALMEHNLVIYAYSHGHAMDALRPSLNDDLRNNPNLIKCVESELSEEEKSFIHERDAEAGSISNGAILFFAPKVIESRPLGSGKFDEAKLYCS